MPSRALVVLGPIFTDDYTASSPPVSHLAHKHFAVKPELEKRSPRRAVALLIKLVAPQIGL